MKNNRLYFVIFVIAFAVNVSAMEMGEGNKKQYTGMMTRKRKRNIENEKIETELNLKKLKKLKKLKNILPALLVNNTLEDLEKMITTNSQNNQKSVVVIGVGQGGRIKVISGHKNSTRPFDSVRRTTNAPFIGQGNRTNTTRPFNSVRQTTNAPFIGQGNRTNTTRPFNSVRPTTHAPFIGQGNRTNTTRPFNHALFIEQRIKRLDKIEKCFPVLRNGYRVRQFAPIN